MWHAWENREKRTRFWWESSKENVVSADPGVDGRMVPKWFLERFVGGGGGVDSAGSGQGQMAGCCGHGDESSSSGVTDLVKHTK
jgi:hypothetical protein